MSDVGYDICVVTLRHKAIVAPRSVTGMLATTEDDEWEKSQGSFLLWLQ